MRATKDTHLNTFTHMKERCFIAGTIQDVPAEIRSHGTPMMNINLQAYHALLGLFNAPLECLRKIFARM